MDRAVESPSWQDADLPARADPLLVILALAPLYKIRVQRIQILGRPHSGANQSKREPLNAFTWQSWTNFYLGCHEWQPKYLVEARN
jgi:hypothetical protein